MSHNKTPCPDYCFSALKLLELLNREGAIQAHVFRNILRDYKDELDITQFSITDNVMVAA